MNLEPISADHEEASDAVGLDAAHRELFDLYNRIIWACHHEAVIVPIRERIRTFVMYALWHFALEEELMRELHYSDRASHKADHVRLQQDAEDLSKAWAAPSGSATCRSSPGTSTTGWLGIWSITTILCVPI